MKTIKIIDLLNKIANGEEDDLITEFEFDKRVWNFKALNDSEFCLDAWLLNQNITITKHKEILEEEKKIPEKINVKGSYNSNKGYEDFNDNEKILVDKINDLLDYLESKEKGE